MDDIKLICPVCKDDNYTNYMDGSKRCDSCNHEWDPKERQLKSPEKIHGAVHQSASVRAGKDNQGKNVVELKFIYDSTEKTSQGTIAVVDRGTAAKLINQLRRALDK